MLLKILHEDQVIPVAQIPTRMIPKQQVSIHNDILHVAFAVVVGLLVDVVVGSAVVIL